MERESSRRRFITGCCVAGAGALAAGGFASVATAGATSQDDAPPTRWEQTYDRGTSLDVNGVAPTSDGHVAVGTAEPGDDETDSEIWVAEVDVAGQVVWEQRFSERAATEGFAIAAADEARRPSPATTNPSSAPDTPAKRARAPRAGSRSGSTPRGPSSGGASSTSETTRPTLCARSTSTRRGSSSSRGGRAGSRTPGSRN